MSYSLARKRTRVQQVAYEHRSFCGKTDGPRRTKPWAKVSKANFVRRRFQVSPRFAGPSGSQSLGRLTCAGSRSWPSARGKSGERKTFLVCSPWALGLWHGNLVAMKQEKEHVCEALGFGTLRTLPWGAVWVSGLLGTSEGFQGKPRIHSYCGDSPDEPGGHQKERNNGSLWPQEKAHFEGVQYVNTEMCAIIIINIWTALRSAQTSTCGRNGNYQTLRG